ncbi:glycosyltransferase family 39 protein [Roseiconus nitratireducens]|uniref:Glycosyltransferase family 39 protein n=1 Tax=Roseiconus nitratireducens TaxID=2605748 RepID=A0A5M6D3Z2_9BACT|nr:glycosyltransferase family 39 protein [Roseiconus nitratireducens]KAA5542201.1 glycosyltransferase family 39 protein [Roseiconus nitratireducens]
MPDRSPSRWLLFAVAVTVVVRVSIMWVTADRFTADPDAYLGLAQTLADHGVFGLLSAEGRPQPTAFRPPLYPAVLAFCLAVPWSARTAITVLHLLLAVLTSILVFLTGRRMASPIQAPASRFNASAAGGLAAVLIALDPILVRQSTEIMTETLAATLSIAVLWAWGGWIDAERPARRLVLAGALGGLMALAYLCRPTFLVWAALVCAAMLWIGARRRDLTSAMVAAAIVAIVVGGWTFRNWRAVGHPVWATTHGGYTLLLANNESFYQYLQQGRFGTAWDATSFLRAYDHRYEGDPRTESFWQRNWKGKPIIDPAITEHQDDRLAYEAAVATIRRHPGLFCWSMVVRVGRLWSPFPHGVASRSRVAVWAVGGFYVVVYALMLWAAWRHRWSLLQPRWWAVWALVLALTAVHAVYWSNLRMRAPAMPALVILASLSLLPSRHRHGSSGTVIADADAR